jgi:hypothetical protein
MNLRDGASCGHAYDDHNRFVRQTGCCPRCGARIARKPKKGRWLVGFSIVALLGMILAAVVVLNHYPAS